MGWQLLAIPNRICLVDIWDERPLNKYITEIIQLTKGYN